MGGVLAAVELEAVLPLIVVSVVAQDLGRAAELLKCAFHEQAGFRAVGILAHSAAQVLKTHFVHGVRSKKLGVRRLQRVR